MEFVDRTLSCIECSQPFIFTAGEQEFYDRKGFRDEPKRCKPCRDARKARKTDKLTEGLRAGGGEDDDNIGNRLPARPAARGPREVRDVQPSGGRPQRETFEAVCAQCGARTRVPFRPVSGRPVYCRDCFGGRRGEAGGQP